MATPHFLQPLLLDDTADCVLAIAGSDVVLATTVEPAFDSTQRKRGLLGRTRLDDGTALIIAPSSAVHTFGMRFPIDLIYCSRDGRVVKLRPDMPARRISVALGAFAVIEMAAGSIARAGLAVGARVVVRGKDASTASPAAPAPASPHAP